MAGVLFMEHLDGTILVTAAPRIAADLGVGSAEIGLAMTVYLVTVATFIPVGGWLAGRFGARRVFCASIAVFTLASVLCAASTSLPALVAGRALQGLGGALMVPVGQLLVLRATDRRDLLRAIAWITWPALLAPVLAPLLGGLLTSWASWHWIFLVNVPVGAVALVAALRLVRDVETERRPLDAPGLLWTTVTVFGLVAGLQLVADPGWAPAGAGLLCAAALSGVAAVRWLLRSAHPLLDLRVYRIAGYRAANSGGLVYRAVVSSVPFLLPLLFQDGFGRSPVESGLLVTAVFLGNVGIKPATTPLLRRFGFRPVLLGSVAGGAACLAAFLLLAPATPLWLVTALLLLSGALRSVGFTAYNSLQFADVEPGRLSSANTLSATGAQLATGLGIAVGALVLQLAASAAPALPSAGDLFPHRVAFAVMAVLLLAPLLGALRLPPGTAAHVAGRLPRTAASRRAG
ncbi:MFS transporter [Kocuria turfanensis]|uniref:MFS transporter n=2 Tax=Kocuria turfanensis TaxID=388357 RepID=A0A512IDW3_9MICC|nr:MFS transporter [Kocuria turfanensis]